MLKGSFCPFPSKRGRYSPLNRIQPSFLIQRTKHRPRPREQLLVLAAAQSWRRARGAWIAADATRFAVCCAASRDKQSVICKQSATLSLSRHIKRKATRLVFGKHTSKRRAYSSLTRKPGWSPSSLSLSLEVEGLRSS